MRIFKRRATAVLEPVRVRTRAGRTAHLQHPDPDQGVLCGWTTPHWERAEPGLQECQLCKLADEQRAAS